MDKQIHFWAQLTHLAQKIERSQDVSRLFREDPIGTIRAYSLDFTMTSGARTLLFSAYLEQISPAARAVVLEKLTARRRRAVVADGGDGGDGDGDDGDDSDLDDYDNPPSPTPTVSTSTIAITNTTVTANAVANVNAIANANSISNANAIGYSPQELSREELDVHVSALAIERQLFDTLEEAGLNQFRQTTLIRQEIRRLDREQSLGGRLPPRLQFEYRGMTFDVRMVCEDGEVTVTAVSRADEPELST
jgi:hypothetical protein